MLMQLIDSIFSNYETLLLFVLFSVILCDNNVIVGAASFFYGYLLSYTGHVFLHNDFCYPNMYSISHYYHHLLSGHYSIFISVINEFLMVTNNLVFKYIIETVNLANFYFVNKWVVLFIFLFYTTSHNINYGYFHVNNYHEKHHEQCKTNLGPDIFDLLFGTKNIDTPNPELIGHYIPNIVFSFMVVYFLKNIFGNSMNYIFGLTWGLVSLFLTILSSQIFYKQIDEMIEKDLQEFLKK